MKALQKRVCLVLVGAFAVLGSLSLQGAERRPSLQALISAQDAYLATAYTCQLYVGLAPYQRGVKAMTALFISEGGSPQQAQKMVQLLAAAYREKATHQQLQQKAEERNMPHAALASQCEKILAQQWQTVLERERDDLTARR